MDQTVNFGDYRFDIATGRLWSNAEEVRLTPKASEVLRALVIHAGEPVSKEHLFASVWKDTVVSDDALTSCIQELRKALADDAKQPRFIETRHRRGYRFAAELSEISAEAVAESPSQAIDLSSIAVLPFADMSPERDQEYLCEGFAEELINALTRIDSLRVASRTSSFQFRSSGADIREVGRRLGVATLLEGSVRKFDHRLRVTVQLIEVATGYHKWSERFDRTLDDVFAIQDEIAKNVVASLRGGMLTVREKPSSPKPQTGSVAYEYYLRGRHYLHLMTQADLKTSGEMFEQAIGLDVGYGPAWGCLAAVYGTLYEWFGASEHDLAIADRASRKALELAPGLPEAHAARGFVLSLSGRYNEAVQEFEDAIHLNPGFFEAYYYFARASFANGEIERSAELFRKASEVRQEDFQSLMLLGQSLRMFGRIDEARDATRKGIHRAERALTLNPVDGRALSLGSGALFHDGQVARALEWSQKSLNIYPDDVCVLINAACLHSKLRHKEEALDLLERVFGRGWGKRDWVEHDPDYDILRDDPRFKKMVANLK
jgi:adenylate cyclase